MLKLILQGHTKFKFLSAMLRWHARYYLRGRGWPVSAGVYLTDVCNSRCIMCDIWKNRDKHVYPRAAQERAVDALAKMGCYYYSISGGEPTLVEDLPGRLAYAAARIPYVHLVTNGFTMEESLARALAASGVKEISISIDGTEDFHNAVRGVDHAYRKAWRALELLRTHAPRVTVVINSLLTPFNLESLRTLSKRLGVFKEKVFHKLLPYSAHALFEKKDLNDFSIFGQGADPVEMDRFLEEAARDPRIVNSVVFLKKAKLYFRGEADLLSEQKVCSYPYHAMEFDSRGCGYSCSTGMNFKGGIPSEEDLEVALRSPEYRQIQRGLEKCTGCRGVMPLCYYEPRLNFPITNFFGSRRAVEKEERQRKGAL